jgi:hypothetical protein
MIGCCYYCTKRADCSDDSKKGIYQSQQTYNNFCLKARCEAYCGTNCPTCFSSTPEAKPDWSQTTLVVV